MDVLGHDYIAHDYEPITLAGLFENREKAVATARGAQTRQSPGAPSFALFAKGGNHEPLQLGSYGCLAHPSRHHN